MGNKVNWTPEIDAQCDELIAKGKNAEYIAVWLFGDKSYRNAIIGRMHRRNKSVRVTPLPVKKPVEPKTKIIRPVVVNRSIKPFKSTPKHCRYPIGDPKSKDFKFCGAKAKTDKPYCVDHCRICYVRMPKREPRHYL